ncbi:hypothetical protein AP064_04010 [Candidatus Liberibacter solanacearum]|uniref:Terminase small subunit n=1 Tax=Candidatus Liberibacter solanacearum TaxID=556287 RepID=A0A0F4VJQ7_9HYPH|nr:hypothetical protein [Candidatus Liberibacter solanacearum]KJZ81686.1 hypothetical protein DJ66_0408 [Candidatus Liberibacter solanacearum]KQC48951.1 hypothetical protein AP064_04010 [Candidatus Liberibacter solanacearum]
METPKTKKQLKPAVKYSAELAKKIIDAVAEGLPLSHALKAPNMPTNIAFFDWLKKYPELQTQYDEARKCRLELMIEEVTNEPEPTEHELANPVFFSKMRDRKQKSVLFLAERLNHQIYGNHMTVEQKHTIDLKPLLDRVRGSIRDKGLKTVEALHK